jgi:phytoene synthase
MTPAAAYAACQALARSHYENFPVASWLLPRHARRHVAAIYAFARIADDFADEPSRPAAQRLVLLDAWQRRLDDAAIGRVVITGEYQQDAAFVALAETIRTLGDGRHAPAIHALLTDLLSAFQQDVTTSRYDTWEEVQDYCRRSANPVGRLVLIVTGVHDEALAGRSDAVCTALQLTNFWQDLAADWSAGRLYVPMEVVQFHRASLDDLDRRLWSPQWRDALRDVGERTRRLFDHGRPVADGVRGRLKWELRATWLGGRRILDRLAEADYDVFRARPALSRSDLPSLVAGAVRWRSYRQS